MEHATSTPFIPFPALTTERLSLRSLELSDAEDIFNHRADKVVNTYLNDFRHSSIEETISFIERVQQEIVDGKTILWVINEKDNPRFMGTVCLWNLSWDQQKAEAGYTLVSQFHRKGYMSKALAKIIDYGFNILQLKWIEAFTHEHNLASIKLLSNKRFIQTEPPNGVGANNRLFFVLNSELQNDIISQT